MIILHGLYGSSDNWLTFAKSISGTFHVYMIDQRNHGQSPHSDIQTFEAMRDDLLEFMNDHTIEKAIITGHSMGGKTAMKFAAAYPERVKALIVLDVSPRSYPYDDPTSNQLNHKTIVEALAALPLDKITSREDADKELKKTIGSERIRQFLLKNLKRPHEGKFEWKINIDVLKTNIHTIFDGIMPNEIKEGNYPSLFVKGSFSDYINEKDFELIRSLFPEAEITTIAGAGHWLHAEKPEELKKIILDFCERKV